MIFFTIVCLSVLIISGSVADDKEGVARRKALAESMIHDIIEKQKLAKAQKESGTDTKAVDESQLASLLATQPPAPLIFVLFRRGAGDGPSAGSPAQTAEANAKFLQQLRSDADGALQGRGANARVRKAFAGCSLLATAPLSQHQQDSVLSSSLTGARFVDVDVDSDLGAAYADEYGVSVDGAADGVVRVFVDGNLAPASSAYTGPWLSSAPLLAWVRRFARGGVVSFHHQRPQDQDGGGQDEDGGEPAFRAHIKARLQSVPAVVVGLFHTNHVGDDPLAQRFNEAAAGLRGHFEFAQLLLGPSKGTAGSGTGDASAAASSSVTGLGRLGTPPLIAVFRTFDEPAVFPATQSAATVDTVMDWIKTEGTNLVDVADRRTFNVFVQQGLPVLLLWTDPAAMLDADLPLLREYRRLATRYAGQIKFLRADAVGNREQAAKFGVAEGAQLPTATLWDMRRFLRFVPPLTALENDRLTVDSLRALCDGYLAGTLAPDVRRQEPLPESANQGPVRVLVYDTFQAEVMGSAGDDGGSSSSSNSGALPADARGSLVAFCVPDNRACRMLVGLDDDDGGGGILGNVARALAAADGGQQSPSSTAVPLVGWIDLSQNDTPRHSIHSMIYGYPTIKYFAAHDKKAKRFEEPTITTESLIKFIQETERATAAAAKKRKLAAAAPPKKAAAVATGAHTEL